ncbi:hypothetical protein ACFQ4K_07560 [Tistrella bauzanensis]
MRSLCQVLAGRMDAINKGQGPAFLRSWDNAAGEGPHDDPALVGAAFAYDNALAVQALIACGRHDAAGRIAAALADAVLTGARSLPDADRNRVRNAYRAGAQTESPPPPNGWWDDSAGRWVEDPYQVGTATGNAAWVALALLSVAERGARGADDSPPPFSAMLRDEARNAARLIGRWVINATADGDDDDGPGGYTGGIAGAGEGRQAIGWKSTEHNADLAAMFTRLAAIDPDQPDWPKAAARARAFLDAMWAAGKGIIFPPAPCRMAGRSIPRHRGWMPSYGRYCWPTRQRTGARPSLMPRQPTAWMAASISTMTATASGSRARPRPPWCCGCWTGATRRG